MSFLGKWINKSVREGLTRDRSIIEEELEEIWVLTLRTLKQKRSWKIKYKQSSLDFEESLEMGEPQEECWRLKSPTTKVEERGISNWISSWKQELFPAPGRQ